jgi:stalled ribosome rescue protein Dom34
MSTPHHVVVWVDHDAAQVMHTDRGPKPAVTVKSQHHYTRQHGSEVRTQHEFFAHVCDALANEDEVLVVGPGVALADFRHYVNKHRPAAANRFLGWQVEDRMTDPQLAALGRKYFDQLHRLGLPATSH